MDPVQLRPDRPDESRELGVISRSQRLEVEVDAVGTAIEDGRRDLASQVESSGRRGEQRCLTSQAARVPAEALDRQHDPSVVGVGGRDDARHLRAGPAAPADARRTVAVALLEVAGRVRADPEVGDCRDLRVIETETARIDLPVRQEPEDLTPQTAQADRRIGPDDGCARARAGRRVIGGARRLDGRRAAGREIDGAGDRGRDGPRRAVRRRAIRRRRGTLGPDRPAVETAGRERGRGHAANGPAVAGAWREPDGDPVAGGEGDPVRRVTLGFLVLDRGLQAGAVAVERRPRVAGCGGSGWGASGGSRRGGTCGRSRIGDRIGEGDGVRIRRAAGGTAGWGLAIGGRETREGRLGARSRRGGRAPDELGPADDDDGDERGDRPTTVSSQGAAESGCHGGPLCDDARRLRDGSSSVRIGQGLAHRIDPTIGLPPAADQPVDGPASVQYGGVPWSPGPSRIGPRAWSRTRPVSRAEVPGSSPASGRRNRTPRP